MNMAFFILLTVLFVNLLRYSEADSGRNVEVINKAPCLEYKNYTLTCKLKNLQPIVEWIYENDLVPIVHCAEKSCKLNPAFKEQYTFSSNFTLFEFNLTVLNVTQKFKGKKLLCSDGSCIDYRVLNVEKKDLDLKDEEGLMKVRSACYSPDRNVTFKWMKIDPTTNKSEVFLPKLRNTRTTHCSNKANGENERRIESVSAKCNVNGNGTKYYLKVEAIYMYGSEMIEKQESSITSDAYTIEELDTEFDTGSEHVEDSQRTTIISVVAVVAVAAVAAVVAAVFRYKIIYTCRRKNRNPGKDTGDVEESFINPALKTLPCKKDFEFRCITSQQSTPEPVEIMPCCDSAQSDRYLVSWVPAQNSSEVISSYTIKYGEIAVQTGKVTRDGDYIFEHYLGDVKKVHVKPTEGEHMICDLQAATHYQIEITANAQSGISSEPRSHIFRTADEKMAVI